MDARVPLQRTIDYIEENLQEEITVEKLAKIATLSLFHYQRLFEKLLNKPVTKYIQMRRMAAVSRVCEKEHRRHVSPRRSLMRDESFILAFRKAYGFVPGEIEKSPELRDMLNKPFLLHGYLAAGECAPVAVDGMVLEICRKTLDAPIEFDDVSCFSRIDNLLPSRYVRSVGKSGTIWGRFIQAHQTRGRDFSHIVDEIEVRFTSPSGAEVENYTGDARKWQLPAGEYAVCGFEVENFDVLVTETVHKVGNYTFSWFRKHGFVCGSFTAEVYYGSIQNPAYVEIWFPIVRVFEAELWSW